MKIRIILVWTVTDVHNPKYSTRRKYKETNCKIPYCFTITVTEHPKINKIITIKVIMKKLYGLFIYYMLCSKLLKYN